MQVTASALSSFVTYVDHHMKDKVFNGGCGAWYTNARGVNWTLWPKDLVSFWWTTYSCNNDDYVFE